MTASVEGGIRFGQYALLRRIARGGMAEVFLAQQRGLEGFDRRVAVKRILPHLADSPDFVKMFLGEAKLVAQLTHPNIVHIYDFGKHEGDYFIAMEFVDGVHAGQIFKHGEKDKISPTLVARIGADAATALHYAHELRNQAGQALGLVHRDVSPANIMVSFDGVVKLCDFGIAKAAALSDQLTNPGQVKGKYAYMSPEQTIASPLDGRSDVFSLAICMWELLTGKTIVGRGDAVDAMRAIRDGRLEPITKAAPKTPPALAKAITWALQTRRENRATAMDFAQALEAFIKSSPELATPMQLGGWVRQRFVREGTGQHAAMPAGVSLGTKAGPATLASPQTPDTPGTAGTSVAIGTHVGTITPPSEMIAASKIKTDEDVLETAETIAISGENTDEKYGKATVLDPVHGSVGNATVERNSSSMIVGSDTIAETELRSGAFRPLVPAGAAAVPTIVEPHLPPPPTRRLATRGPADSQPRLLQRVPRRVIAIGGLVALAVISFLVALAARSPARSAQRDAGAVVTATPDVMPVDTLTVEPIELSDAREPTVRSDAGDPASVLEIRTKPPGGIVRVSGVAEARVDPARFALPAGAYTITAELAGYHDETRDVLMDGRTDVVQDLIFARRIANRPAPKTGKLSARTTPYSVVFHKGKRLGETPFADKELPVGTYVLTFRNPDRKPVTRTVTIVAGKTQKLSFNLP